MKAISAFGMGGLATLPDETVLTVGTLRTVASVGNSLYTGIMPRQKDKDPDELTSREAANFLNVTLPRFYELVSDGAIQKFYKPFGKRPYYSKARLQQLLDDELRKRQQDADTSDN